MRDIALVMVTVDRAPSENYLRQTLANLRRSGLDTCRRLRAFCIVDSGTDRSWVNEQVRASGMQTPTVDTPQEHRCASLNVAAALRIGATSGATWVVFIEDDIDVCADFLCSAGAWLDRHARPDVHVYAFGAAFAQLKERRVVDAGEWRYPVSAFYGTQAMALRCDDAASLAVWLEACPYAEADDGTAYDMAMHKWSRHTWPDVTAFLASAPSFVQHIGSSSVINPRKFVHTFNSWKGRKWSYLETLQATQSPPSPQGDGGQTRQADR